MRIMGVDLNARQQAIAIFNAVTGELIEKTLNHEAEAVRVFYSSLSEPVHVGIGARVPGHRAVRSLCEATGSIE